MRPDLAMFIKHVQQAEFIVGVEKGMWGISEYDSEYPHWPLVYLWVAATPKDGKPDKYYFKFDLSGYPNAAPTACLWDIAKNQKLDYALWPKGQKFVSSVFRPGWKNGEALYAPCDRGADLPGHSNWQVEHPNYYWKPTFTITVYLNFLYELLNSGDYANS